MKGFITGTLLLAASHIFAQSPRINFKAPVFYPEGVAYNSKTNLFYVGSVKTGTISTVDASGNFKEFYKDTSLKSGFGMKADLRSNSLWICTGDPNYSMYSTVDTYKKLIRLICVDLTTGAKKKDIDLSGLYEGKHFANDLILDGEGNIYITDSYSPVIYKVDATGNATVFVENGLFQSMDIGLNGIALFPGFLIVVNNSNGTILKVDIKTKAVNKVKIDQFFPGADGLLADGKDLILIQNKGVDKVYRISSNDSWSSAKVISATATEDRFQHPSTGVMQGNKIYALNSKLNELQDPSQKPSEEFSLQLVQLKPVL